jgi:4-amino-4-deoxy-L-arabinose transferase-like glycosyltransferase
LLLGQIGSSHLSNFDDCFYAQRAKEMLHGGDWITPHWNGEAQVDNPPFFMWLIALSFAVFGITGAAAILPSALSGVGCVALTYGLAPRVGLDRFGAWASAFVLLTTGYFLKFSGHAMLDVLVTFLVLGAIAFHGDALEKDPRWHLASGVCLGLAILTKSVVGVLPGLALLAHVAWTRGPKRLLDPWLLGGCALAAVVGGWWFVYEWAARPAAFEQKWHWMLYERSFTIGNESLPWWKYFDYFVQLAREYWPWLPVAAVGAWMVARRAWAGDSGARLLMLWFLAVVVPLSLANEKKLWYVMAVFPCLALFAGTALAAWIVNPSTRRRVSIGGFALLFVAAIVVDLLPIKLSIERRPDLQRMALAARTLVPAGEPVVSYDIEFYSVTPQFLFYSDRTLTQPMASADQVRSHLIDGEWALLKRESYAEVVGADSVAYPIVVASGGWTLVHAAPRPAVTIEPREPYR